MRYFVGPVWRGLRWPSYRWAILAMVLAFLAISLALLSLALAHKHVVQQKQPSTSVDFVYFQGKVKDYHPTAIPSILDSLEAGAKRMTERRRILNDGCAALLPQQHLSANEFLISENPTFVFCPVYRAASASWIANMLRFRGARLPRICGRAIHKPSEPPLSLIRKHYPRPTSSQLTRALATSPSLIIVRHPLDRLLSAYRDAEFTDLPDFQAFANRLIKEHAAGVPISDPRWAPVSNFCTPCAAEFSYIAKVETLAADQRYLLLAEPALADSGASAQWCHPNRRGVPTTSVLSSRYYASLPSTLVRSLAAIYAEDMRLFGYSLRGYIAEQST